MIRLLLSAVFALAPALATAQHACESETQTQTCAEGSKWDAEQAKCVPMVSS